jgi:hypothetical protein
MNDPGKFINSGPETVILKENLHWYRKFDPEKNKDYHLNRNID